MVSRNGSKRGFAGMDPERQREIARRGGQARNRNRQSSESSSNTNQSNDLGNLM